MLSVSLFSVEKGDPIHSYFVPKIGYGPDTGGVGLDFEWKINFASFRLGAGFYNENATGSVGAKAFWNVTKNVAGFVGINYGAVTSYYNYDTGLYENIYKPYMTFGVASVVKSIYAELSVGIYYDNGEVKEVYQSSIGFAFY